MTRYLRPGVVAAGVVGTGVIGAVLLVLQRPSADADRGHAPVEVALRPAYEPDAREAPPPTRMHSDIAKPPAVSTEAGAAAIDPEKDSSSSVTDAVPGRDADESSEQFRHSRRGDGQHAE